MKAGQAYRIATWIWRRRALVLPVEHGAQRRAAARGQPGPPARPGRARSAGAPDAEEPQGRVAGRELRGQWLNLRGLDATSPLPLIYPDFDNPLRQAIRREVELLFDSIVREDRSVVDLLTADDTFRQRAAGQALWRGTTGEGSQFRQGSRWNRTWTPARVLLG